MFLFGSRRVARFTVSFQLPKRGQVELGSRGGYELRTSS